jgi:hypothetical protein
MRNTWRAAAVVGLITGAAVFGTAAAAVAATPPAAAPSPSACNTPVTDYTPQGVLRGDSTLIQAMSKLEAKGIDVRIRVLTAAPGGSLDYYEQTMIAGCPSWSLGGTIKPNLLVILVSLDHQDAIFYGSNLARLQKQVDQIRADMGSSFEAGNFTAGITKGETESYSTLYPSGIPAWEIILAVVVGLIILAAFAAPHEEEKTMRFLKGKINDPYGTMGTAPRRGKRKPARPRTGTGSSQGRAGDDPPIVGWGTGRTRPRTAADNARYDAISRKVVKNRRVDAHDFTDTIDYLKWRDRATGDGFETGGAYPWAYSDRGCYDAVLKLRGR